MGSIRRGRANRERVLRLAHRRQRWWRSLPLGCLLAGLMFAAIPASASAAIEVRGEWELAIATASQSGKGKVIVSQEANSNGEFMSSSGLFEGSAPGTWWGTIHPGETEATVRVHTVTTGSRPEVEFNSTTMKIETIAGKLTIVGEGKATSPGYESEARLVITKLKTYKQVEEKEATEKREKEEQEAREEIRGEWALAIESTHGTLKGTATISAEANSKNEFTSSTALFEDVDPGSFSGKLEGDKATVTIITQAYDGAPEGRFTSSAITLSSATDPSSMSGKGTITIGTEEFKETTLTATRVKTYQKIVEEETAARKLKEKEEQEAKEKTEQEEDKRKAQEEAKVKAEEEVKLKAEQEAKAKAEQEAKEKAAQEAAAKAAQEAKEKQEHEAQKQTNNGPGTIAALVSVSPGATTLTVASSGTAALALENPNDYAVEGHVTLTLSKASSSSSGKHKAGKKQIVSVGTASFAISSHGSTSIVLHLSATGREELSHHKTLRVLASLVTQASGQPSATKTYSFTLRVAKPAHRKG
jgi:hypothetical protein